MSTRRYRRRFGDRSDGRLLRSLPAFSSFIPFIMPTRNDALNLYSDEVEISSADRWLRAQRVEGYKGIGFLHIIIAAYIRCIAFYPGLNRFVAGRRIYAANDVAIVMAVKRSLTIDGSETMIKVHFDPSDTVYDVYRKMNEAIDEIKSGEEDNSTEEAANKFKHLPRFIFRMALGVLRMLDYFGILPKSLIEVSPFHGSMIITDLGSLGIKPVYHHIYNFGTLPVFIAFGAKRKKIEVNRHGQLEENKYLDFRATLDERIVDGHYHAACLKKLKYFIAHPEELAVPPAKVEEDIF